MTESEKHFSRNSSENKRENSNDDRAHLSRKLWEPSKFRTKQLIAQQPKDPFDARQSVEELVQEHKHQFDDMRSNSHHSINTSSLNSHFSGVGKSIKVEHASSSSERKNDASFRVEQNGTIQIFANPELHSNSSVVVIVDGPPSSSGNSRSQSLAKFLDYLSEHFGHERAHEHEHEHAHALQPGGKSHSAEHERRGNRHRVHLPICDDYGNSQKNNPGDFTRNSSYVDVRGLMAEGPGAVSFTGDVVGRNSFAAKLAFSAERQSVGSFAHYECSHYLREAFDRVDPGLDRLFAGCAKNDHFQDDPRFEIICSDKRTLDLKQLQPGDTIVYGPTIGTNDAGHVETMGLDHLMHSDFTHKLTMEFVDKYKWLTVYRPCLQASDKKPVS